MAQKKKIAQAKKSPPKTPQVESPAPVAQGKKLPEGPPKEDEEAAEIVAIPFDLRILDGLDEATFDGPVRPPTYFAVQLQGPLAKRFVHVIQKDERGWVVMMLLGDRESLGKVKRVPCDGAWLRAIVDGPVHVLGADIPLLRDEIAKYLGGHEPGPTQAKPPYL